MRRSLLLAPCFSPAPSAIIRSFHCCPNCPDSGVSWKKTKLRPGRASKKVHRIGAANKPEIRIPTRRNRGIPTPLRFRGSMSSRVPIICDHAGVNPSGNTAPSLGNSKVRTNPLELGPFPALRAKICPILMPPSPAHPFGCTSVVRKCRSATSKKHSEPPGDASCGPVLKANISKRRPGHATQ